MWWLELASGDPLCGTCGQSRGCLHVDSSADVSNDTVLDASFGPITIGARTRICRGAVICGPVVIGADCLIGNLALVRGRTRIGDGVRIGFAAEIKNAIIEDRVTIGPQCFVADSKVERGAYLGAQVRTSNHRLDGKAVEVMMEGKRVDTGLEKLGCRIGEGAALGIQVIVLPGREIAAGSTFAPRITVERNLPAGRYRLAQQLETY